MAGSDQNPSVQMSEVIEALQRQLTPLANHYVDNFSITMTISPPRDRSPSGNDSTSVTQDVCNNVACPRVYTPTPNCETVQSSCSPESCSVVSCGGNGHECTGSGTFSCGTVSCINLSTRILDNRTLGSEEIQRQMSNSAEN